AVLTMHLLETLDELCRRYDLVAIYAFGSRAREAAARVRGEAPEPEYPNSDLDIGVQPRPGRRLKAVEKVELAQALEDLFGVSRVDLVAVTEAPPFLAYDVVRGELLACTDPDAQARYELYVLARAGDLAPWYRERVRAILEEGAR
ncbi:nucleotidyltransferase domain-containing protein, partial [Deferrisoma palaeochoriense]